MFIAFLKLWNVYYMCVRVYIYIHVCVCVYWSLFSPSIMWLPGIKLGSSASLIPRTTSPALIVVFVPWLSNCCKWREKPGGKLSWVCILSPGSPSHNHYLTEEVDWPTLFSHCQNSFLAKVFFLQHFKLYFYLLVYDKISFYTSSWLGAYYWPA